MTSTLTDAGSRVGSASPLYAEINDWLIDEAALLDERQFAEWLTLLDPGIRYTMPVRQSGEEPRSDGSQYFHFDENAASLDLRVRRLDHAAWAEQPFTRTRRFVSNLRVHEAEHGYLAQSNLLVMCSRQASPDWEMVSCRRHDMLRRSADASLRLVARTIEADQVVLGVTTLSILL